MSDDQKGRDILGVKPIADAALVIVQGAVDGAGAFLGRICLPAAEEFGLLLRDKVSAWRNKNVQDITQVAETILRRDINFDRLSAHPKVVGRIIELGSWEESPDVQKMWAGLLASSCNETGDDQRNIIFIDLLSRITKSQAILFEYSCRMCQKRRAANGCIISNDFIISDEDVFTLLGTNDIHQADIELDHLREIGLLGFESGFNLHDNKINIRPSALGLHFFVRCQGFRGDVFDFFDMNDQ